MKKQNLTISSLYKENESYKDCVLCPRECHVNRMQGAKGVCAMDATIRVARAALHYWEEPCISGTNGSGAVFFSGCAMHCVFCQNEPIAQGESGIAISRERLAEIFLELQEQKANNINLVTPGQYVPDIIVAVEEARRQGLHIPIVYNTSAYEKVDTLKMLEGIVDIYLPDFKYMDMQTAGKYSHAPDYPSVAKDAIAEMVRQQPHPEFMWETLEQGAAKSIEEGEKENTGKIVTDTKARRSEPTEDEEGAIMRRGVIVRQLLLPGKVKEAQKIVTYLHEHYGNQIYLSMMSQYTPLPHADRFPELARRVSKREYNDYIDEAIRIGVEQAFIQEGDVAEESFIPDFLSGEGVLHKAFFDRKA